MEQHVKATLSVDTTWTCEASTQQRETLAVDDRWNLA